MEQEKNFFQKEQEKNELSPEELLAEFKQSLEKYGIKGVECRLEQSKLVIEQTLGKGIHGLGYDKKAQSLWMCLDQSSDENVKENQRWNANTILDKEKKLPETKLEEIEKGKIKVTLTSSHPVTILASLLNRDVCLPGQFNN